MKRTLSTLGQFLLFFLAYFVGSFVYHPFGLVTRVSGSDLTARSYQWDGLILTGLVYLLIVLVEAFGKRLQSAAPLSTFALFCAAVVGYLLKFGFVTHKW